MVQTEVPAQVATSVQSEQAATFKHQNGHVTGLAHYGNMGGPVVFYFHGCPSSRLEGALWHEAAERVGVHIVALDRPGIGLSSVMPGRTSLSWPLLVQELAEHLGFRQFYVLGCSAGGQYALTCAKELPSQTLIGAGVVAGMSPVALGLDGMTFGSRLAIYVTKYLPWLGQKLHDWMVIPAAQNHDPKVFDKLITDSLAYLDTTDRALFEDEETRKRFIEAAREHYRQGNKGLLDDWRIFVSDWGFELDSVERENIMFWCGTKDMVCPVTLSRKMASQIKQAKLIEFDGETHYSIVVIKNEQILRELTGRG